MVARLSEPWPSGRSSDLYTLHFAETAANLRDHRVAGDDWALECAGSILYAAFMGFSFACLWEG
jgi:hypothetical protein